MPLVDFNSLPGDARVWIFATSQRVEGKNAEHLTSTVDDYLREWRAHEEPLTCARDWRDDHFLAIGVDQSTAGASGCSIDAMFRILKGLERTLGITLLGGARLFYRDADGAVQCVDRPGLARAAERGAVTGDTPVFDTTVTTAEAYRKVFERPLRDSWHRELAGQAAIR